MNFLRPSVFDLQTDDLNPNFQPVNKKRVNHKTNNCFWDNLPPNLTKKSGFKIESLPLHFHFICSII